MNLIHQFSYNIGLVCTNILSCFKNRLSITEIDFVTNIEICLEQKAKHRKIHTTKTAEITLKVIPAAPKTK